MPKKEKEIKIKITEEDLRESCKNKDSSAKQKDKKQIKERIEKALDE